MLAHLILWQLFKSLKIHLFQQCNRTLASSNLSLWSEFTGAAAVRQEVRVQAPERRSTKSRRPLTSSPRLQPSRIARAGFVLR